MEFQITSEDVIDIAPELATGLTVRQWEVALRNARLNIALDIFGTQERANMASAFLAAHFATRMLFALGGAGGITGADGPLSSITVGSVSKTYATATNFAGASAGLGDYMTTPYGREYARLLRIYGPRIGVA